MVLERFKQVLNTYKELLLNIVGSNIEDYDTLESNILSKYGEINRQIDKEEFNKYHIAFIVPVISIYKVLRNKYNVPIKQAIDVIYSIIYYRTEAIFNDFSFVQLAYYIICNKPYLKQLMLMSICEFQGSLVEDSLQEHIIDDELQDDLNNSEINIILKKQNVPELSALLVKVDEIIDEFVETHFTRHKRKLSLEDIF